MQLHPRPSRLARLGRWLSRHRVQIDLVVTIARVLLQAARVLLELLRWWH